MFGQRNPPITGRVAEFEKQLKAEPKPFPKRKVQLRKPQPELYDLPKFSPKGKCPACHFGMIKTEHKSGSESYPMIGQHRFWPWAYLLRTCAQCGHSWKEEPFDVPADRAGAIVEMWADNEYSHDVATYARF